MDMFMALMAVIISSVYTYPQIHGVEHYKYGQLFTVNHTLIKWFKNKIR